LKKNMTAIALTERESLILNSLVESYVTNAAPVGSRTLSKKHDLGISPATIRNVMNDLEDLGYLSQPHVSAGRIPTDKGYRFYVDSLMRIKTLAKRDRNLIEKNLLKISVDVTDILASASQVLGKISTQLGVVLEPRFYQGVFEKMELVSVSGNRILAVISIKSGLVKTIMMEIESEVSGEQLHEASQIINERLSGLSLKEVKETIDKRLAGVATRNDRLIRLIVESSNKLFNFENQKELHLGGTHNIVTNPEFLDQKYASRILQLLESKQSILHLLSDKQTEEVSISIGDENQEDGFTGFGVITTRYYVGNVSGTLGVVGPTRMQYAEIVPLVDFMGKILTQTFHTRLS